MHEDPATVAKIVRPGPNAAPRAALALGMIGALGEEVLAQLLASPAYHRVHVGVTQPINSATARFVAWIVGQGTPVVDDAYVCVADETTVIPAASPIRAFTEEEVLDAARAARAAGARRLVVIAPLAALLQMNEAVRTLAGAHEVELIELGFEQLIIVRPTARDLADGTGMRGLVQAAGRALADIMLPTYARALAPQTAARAILEAVLAAPAGLSVLGAKDLLAIIEARLPALAPRKRRLR